MYALGRHRALRLVIALGTHSAIFGNHLTAPESGARVPTLAMVWQLGRIRQP